jgi:hypothetical protein
MQSMKHAKGLWPSLLIIVPALLVLSSCRATDLPLIGMNAALPESAPDFEEAPASTFTIEVASEEIGALIESSSSFAVYIGNEYCSNCNAFQPAFFEYIFETGMLVYHYDNVINGDDYDLLTAAYPDYFPTNPSTPTLMFFKQGELRTLQKAATRMNDITTLRPIMESYAQVIDLPVIHDENTYAEMNHDGIYFVYDRNDEATVGFYNEHLVPLIVEEGYALRQLEISLDEDLAEAVAASLTDFSPTITFYLLQDGAITEAVSLGDAGLEATLSWLSANN